MKHQSNSTAVHESHNEAVKKAYFHILKKTKEFIATIKQDELRFTLERRETKEKVGAILHELVSPVVYLRLELHTDNVMAIHFGIEQINQLGHLSELTTKFLRLLYRDTSKEVSGINIENCVRTDWFINSCSAMYEYIELCNKYHTFKQIKYKTVTPKRDQILSVV